MNDAVDHGLEAITWNVVKPEIEQLFAEQWADPELPCMEYRSSARLANWLRCQFRGLAAGHECLGLQDPCLNLDNEADLTIIR